MSDALAEYQDFLLHVRGAVTARTITRAIERFLGEHTSLGAITPTRAAALYEAETRRILDGKGQPVAAASHRTVLGQCKRFYAWAVEKGYAAQNPFVGIKPVGRPKVGKSQLRIDEARRFVPQWTPPIRPVVDSRNPASCERLTLEPTRALFLSARRALDISGSI